MRLCIWIFLLTCFLVLAVAASNEEPSEEVEDRRRRKGRKKRKKGKKAKKEKSKWKLWRSPRGKRCKCGIENGASTGRSTEEDRVIGGAPVGRNQYPWLVGLSLDKIDHPITCVGTLLDSRWVLTAAHCVQKHVGDQNVWARIGEHERGSAGSYVVRAKAIYIHPYYDAKKYHHDMALIWLPYHVPIGTKTITPVCIPRYQGFHYYYYGFHETLIPGIVAGWGGTKKDGTEFPNVPHDAAIDIISNTECSRLYKLKGSKAPQIIDDQVCTLDTSGNKDTCAGDSGGPLMIKSGYSRFYVHGVLAFGGHPCADPTTPAVYTRVGYYGNIKWLSIVRLQKHNGHNQFYYCRY